MTRETEQFERERRLDLTVLSLPVITVISLVLFVGWSTFTVAQEKSRYDARLENTSKLIEQLAVATRELSDTVATLSQAWWSREDMAAFCQDVQHLNPTFKCPNIVNAGYNRINRLQSTGATVKKKLDAIRDSAKQDLEKSADDSSRD